MAYFVWCLKWDTHLGSNMKMRNWYLKSYFFLTWPTVKNGHMLPNLNVFSAITAFQTVRPTVDVWDLSCWQCWRIVPSILSYDVSHCVTNCVTLCDQLCQWPIVSHLVTDLSHCVTICVTLRDQLCHTVWPIVSHCSKERNRKRKLADKCGEKTSFFPPILCSFAQNTELIRPNKHVAWYLQQERQHLVSSICLCCAVSLINLVQNTYSKHRTFIVYFLITADGIFCSVNCRWNDLKWLISFGV
jgi:hypothetical protein